MLFKKHRQVKTGRFHIKIWADPVPGKKGKPWKSGPYTCSEEPSGRACVRVPTCRCCLQRARCSFTLVAWFQTHLILSPWWKGTRGSGVPRCHSIQPEQCRFFSVLYAEFLI